MDNDVLQNLMKTRLFKAGGKSTEFYVMLAVMAIGLATSLGWINPVQANALHTVAPEVLGLVMTLLGAWGYNSKRAKVKDIQGQLLKALQQPQVEQQASLINTLAPKQLLAYLDSAPGQALLRSYLKSKKED